MLNESFRQYRLNPEDVNARLAFQKTLTSAAFALSGVYSGEYTRFSRFGEIIHFMNDYSASYNGNDLLSDLLAAVRDRFR